VGFLQWQGQLLNEFHPDLLKWIISDFMGHYLSFIVYISAVRNEEINLYLKKTSDISVS